MVPRNKLYNRLAVGDVVVQIDSQVLSPIDSFVFQVPVFCTGFWLKSKWYEGCRPNRVKIQSHFSSGWRRKYSLTKSMRFPLKLHNKSARPEIWPTNPKRCRDLPPFPWTYVGDNLGVAMNSIHRQAAWKAVHCTIAPLHYVRFSDGKIFVWSEW